MKAYFFSTRFSQIAALLLLLTLGLGIRLYDLNDLPLDFHPTRQLLSALKARGMYYETLTDVPAEQRSFAIQQWKFRAAIEPEIVERMAAFTYQFTGEQLWVARIYSSLFWVIGAVFLFLLARRSHFRRWRACGNSLLSLRPVCCDGQPQFPARSVDGGAYHHFLVGGFQMG